MEKKKPEPRRYVSSIEEIAREKVASNMIKLKVLLSLEEITELTSLSFESVIEIHAKLTPDSEYGERDAFQLVKLKLKLEAFALAGTS